MKPFGGAVLDRIEDHAFDLLDEARISPITQQCRKITLALQEIGQDIDGTRTGLEVSDRFLELIEIRLRQCVHKDGDIRQGILLNRIHEIGNIPEVGVERTACHAGRTSHPGNRYLRKIPCLLDLARQRVAQRLPCSHASAIGPSLMSARHRC